MRTLILLAATAAATLVASAGAGVTRVPAFYVDGTLYRTVNTPTDLTNFVGQTAIPPAPPVAPAAEPFYRKTPAPRAAAAGGGGARIDLDVPAFLRKQGGGNPASE